MFHNVNIMYITEKCEYVFVQNQKKVALRLCGK